MAATQGSVAPGTPRLVGFGVAILALLSLGLVIYVYGSSVASGGLTAAVLLFLGYLLGVLFLGIGVIEIILEASKKPGARTYLVPVLYVFIGLVTIVFTYLNGTTLIPGASQLSVLFGLLAVLVIGQVAFAVMDAHYASARLSTPVGSQLRVAKSGGTTVLTGQGSGTGQTIVIENKASSAGKVLSFIEFVVVVVVLVFIYIEIEDFLNKVSCGFIFCGLMVLDPSFRARAARAVGVLAGRA